MAPPTLVVLTLPPWTAWGAALRPVYLTCLLTAHVLATAACVAGRLRNRSTGRRAWSVLAVALASVTVILGMEGLLPPEALTAGLSGVTYIGASVVLALAVVAVPLPLVRARLN